MKQQNETVLQRKKLWQIDECYTCSVIGICLGRGEMHTLNRQKVFDFGKNLDDYQLHTLFIKASRYPSVTGKALHRHLEKKFRLATAKYFRVRSDAEILELWRADLAEGRVAEAWWAITTHPLVSYDLVAKFYGQLHMLGHDGLGTMHKKQRMLVDLKNKVEALQEVLVSERKIFRQENRSQREEIASVRGEIDQLQGLFLKNKALAEEISGLKRLLAESGKVAEHHTRDAAKYQRLTELSAILDRMRNDRDTLVERVSEYECRQEELLAEGRNKDREIAVLEDLLRQNLDRTLPCNGCAEQDSGRCPGITLCGKTVLYVGGLTKLVPHYRQLVEQGGGRFVHHDGGKQEARALLPKMLATADVVLCPVDCVSHDACNCAKKICKRYSKPFVLMRSASLSAFAKGLSDIQ